MGRMWNSLMHKRWALCFCLLGLGLVGCVDAAKIDQTNTTLERNLAELEKLNRNFVKSTDRLTELGVPIADMGLCPLKPQLFPASGSAVVGKKTATCLPFPDCW